MGCDHLQLHLSHYIKLPSWDTNYVHKRLSYWKGRFYRGEIEKKISHALVYFQMATKDVTKASWVGLTLGTRSLFWISHIGAGAQWLEPPFAVFLAMSRELNRKWSSWANWCTYGMRCCRLLCHHINHTIHQDKLLKLNPKEKQFKQVKHSQGNWKKKKLEKKWSTTSTHETPIPDGFTGKTYKTSKELWG